MTDHIDRAAEVLIEHTRTRIEGCHCGWSKLGASHAEHVTQALDAAGLLRRPNDPEVHVEETTQGSTCVVKVAGQVVFNGVSREHAILTPSGVKHDAAVAAKALRDAADKVDRDRRIHDASCGESPAQSREQAGRDYGVTTGLRRAVRHLNERADRIERGD